MADKFKEQAVVISNQCISNGIYSMWIKTEKIAGASFPGQFVSVYCKDGSRLLPRPISLCEIHRREAAIRMVYRIAGAGTKELSALEKGAGIRIIGPLGNGFPLREKKAMLIGGGIGIPPLLQLAKDLNGEKQFVFGYRDETFMQDDFKGIGNMYIATEDGSSGTEGNVLDAIRENGLNADIIYACGPIPMLRAVKEYAFRRGIECFLSLEEKMACGIGACLACVCRTKNKDPHTNVYNKRICKEGPVFRAEEVEF